MYKRPRTKRKGLYAAVGALAVAFILTGCGARIDTTMNVSDSGSGERVMVLSLSASNLSKLTGGAAAADASIRRHLPASLSYSGLRETSDGNETATLTLAFDSTADYKKKATELLNAGGISSANIDFSVSDSLLVKGITLQEDRTSGDLLKWMFDDLISDGVVSSGDSSNMYEVGTSVVKFGGSTTQPSSPFNISNVMNNGFDSVTMKTQILDANHITRTVTYTAEDAHYAANKDVLTKFINQSTPDGAQVTTPSEGTWTMTFSGDPNSIASATTHALGGGSAVFALNLSDAPGDPSEKVLTVTDTASCDAVCATSTPITDTVNTVSDYTPKNAEIDTSAQAPATFTYAPPIKSVAVAFHFDVNGSIGAKVDFVVPKASIDAVGDGFAKRLNPANGTGTLETAQNDSNTTYTVTISGKNAEDFATKYKEWAPDSSIAETNEGSGLFLHQTGYTIGPALQNLTGHHAVTDGATSKIVLPFGQWVTNAPAAAQQAFGVGGSTITVQGLESAISVHTDGPTLGGLITIAILLAVTIIGVFILIRRRHAVMERLRAVRAQTAADLAEQRLLRFDKTAPRTAETVATVGSLLRLRTKPGPPPARASLLDLRAPVVPPAHPTWNLFIDAPMPQVTGTRRGTLFDIEHNPEFNARPPQFV